MDEAVRGVWVDRSTMASQDLAAICSEADLEAGRNEIAACLEWRETVPGVFSFLLKGTQ